MALSNDLISQFIKTTNDSYDKKNNKTTSYGTVVKYGNDSYVQLDGSDLLTPVSTTIELNDNDRVVVDINDHNALVTGNVSNPAIGKMTAGALSSEIAQTAESLTATITDVRNDLTSQIAQTSTDLTMMFKDGYNEGSTIVNQNGIRVTHSAYNGYTHIAAHGFSLYKDGKAIFNCTSGGMNYTGTITASTIKSNDGTFEIDKNGNIKGASLKSSKGGNFSIDENGEITAVGLSVEGNISTNTLVCKEISNKEYPKSLSSGITIYVNPNSGNDDVDCVNGARFKTMQGAVDALPKFLNGKVVNIHLEAHITNNVSLNYFVSGRIFIYLHGYRLFGSLNIYHCDTAVFVYGGASTSDTTRAVIHPSTGVDAGSRTSSIYANVSKYVGIYNMEVYGSDNQNGSLTGDKIAVSAQGGGLLYCSNIRILNCHVGFRCFSGAHIHMNTSSGIASKYGFQAVTGGRISFANSSQTGGSTAATNKASGGQIWTDSCTFESGGATSGSGSASTGSTTSTKTFTASSAQALQYAGQSGAFWRTDCKPKVGDWGYGPHTGWWFFGDDFESMASRNVTKIEITFTRNKAGNYAATAHRFFVHNYETQPSTKSPTYNTSQICSASVAVEKTHTMTITDATIINRIKTAKGICSVPAAQSSTYYSVMSPTMKVKFTYTT